MSRFVTACRAFWAILGSPAAAQRWLESSRPPVAPPGPTPTPAAPPPLAAARVPGGMSADAVFTLVLLQREGRLVDFLQESLEGLADAQVGAAARQIHGDCRRVLQQVFGVTPVRTEAEGSPVTLEPGFDPRHVRLTGAAPAGPTSCSGTLRHRGWRVTRVAFPQRHESLDSTLICPAEVEVTR